MLPKTTVPPSVGPPELEVLPPLELEELLLELEVLPPVELEEAPPELEDVPLLVNPLEEPVPLEVLVPVGVPVPEVAPELVDVLVLPELVDPLVVLLPPEPVLLPVDAVPPPVAAPLPPEDVALCPEVPPSGVEASALVPDSLAPPQAAATSDTGRTAIRTRIERIEDMSPPDRAHGAALEVYPARLWRLKVLK
jgi:hypothetical protein